MEREIRRSRSGSCNGSSRYEESGVIVEKEEWRSWKGEVSGEEGVSEFIIFINISIYYFFREEMRYRENRECNEFQKFGL